MRVRDYIERLTRSLRDPGTKDAPLDKQQLMAILSEELEYLSGEFQWDWAASTIRPAIRTVVGKREYSLPIGFGLNFARGADRQGEAFTVTLSDASNEGLLRYESPARFYSRNLLGESNNRPSLYTIRTDPMQGRRLMVLSSPPDANGDTGYYEINGLYVPENWNFNDADQMMPVPGNNPLLKHRVLARVYETRNRELHAFHVRQGQHALSKLLLLQARSRRTRLSPKLSRTQSGNTYTLVRRR